MWGSTVLDVRFLERGESLDFGDPTQAGGPLSGAFTVAPSPIRAVGGAWELDARGAINGVLKLRGRDEDVAHVARIGAAIPILPGDYGLIQYGLFSVFFQYTVPARRNPYLDFFMEWIVGGFMRAFTLEGMSMGCAFVVIMGGLGLLRALQTPPQLPPPLDLMSPDELAKRFKFERAVADEEKPPPAAAANSSGGGSGVKNPGAKDNKPQGGGQKMAGKEGKFGLKGQADHSELRGAIQPSTDLGSDDPVFDQTEAADIRKTLDSVRSVSDALGGLNSDNIVLGANSGYGLHGSDSGGGGTGRGVPFGSGTLAVGWGPGAGGGYGSGNGGPGGAGSGGNGLGGHGGGNGTGNGNGNGNGTGNGDPGERGVGIADPGKRASGLTPQQVQRVVGMHLGAVRGCFEVEARNNPNLKGGVTISWVIGPDGGVAGASISGNSIGSARVANCVLRQVNTWHFPSSDGNTNTTYPFVYVGSR